MAKKYRPEKYTMIFAGNAEPSGQPLYRIFEWNPEDDAYYPTEELEGYGIGNNRPCGLAGSVAKLTAIRDVTEAASG